MKCDSFCRTTHTQNNIPTTRRSQPCGRVLSEYIFLNEGKSCPSNNFVMFVNFYYCLCLFQVLKPFFCLFYFLLPLPKIVWEIVGKREQYKFRLHRVQLVQLEYNYFVGSPISCNCWRGQTFPQTSKIFSIFC